MPKRKRSYRRRSSRKRRRTRRKYKSLRVRRGLLPRGYVAKLTYFGKNIVIDPNAGTAASYFFSANGMFDPDKTALLGAQPRGYDQMMTLFDHYAVIYAHMSVIMHTAQASTNQYLVGVCIDDDAVATGSAEDFIEGKRSKWAYLNGQDLNNGPVVKTFRIACRPHRYLGVGKTNSKNLGAINANPSDEVLFRIWAQDTGSANPASIRAHVKITYYAKFIEPRTPPQS